MTSDSQFTGASTRREALGMIAAGTVAGMASWPANGLARAARSGRMPWLASPQQLAAENMVLELERDPQVRAIQARIRRDLAASARGQIPSAAATLDRAIAQWTRSLIFGEVIKRPWAPVMLWSTDDTSRTWLGHTLGGVGTSGDNPDSIYRSGMLEGGGRYELLGQFHPGSRPTQLLIEVDAGDLTQPQKLLGGSGNAALDVHSNSLITDRELVVAPDGSFRISIGGSADGPNHLGLPASGACTIGSRDILNDWRLRACRMELRRLDKVPQRPFGLAEVRQLVYRDLENYVRFWAHFPDIWMGALKPNTHAQPAVRPGGWGFVAGLNYHLAPDEGLLVTKSPGEATYIGFQVIDPWMIAPDARSRQVCLNTSQSMPNADGTFTYVLAKSDPGIANWLDTAGLDDGLAIMRWQKVPAGMTNEGLIRDFRVIKLADLAGMPDLPRVSPKQRREIVAARAPDYDTRVM